MNFDNFGIPSRIIGVTNPELPTLIGCIVMLATLLEIKVWAITVSVANGPQSDYAALPVARNIETIKSRLPSFQDSPREVQFVDEVKTFMEAVELLLDKRNGLVHRVWSHGTSAKSGGWKHLTVPQRSDGKKSLEWIEVSEYTSDDLRQIIREFVEINERAIDMVSLAASMDRKSD